MTNTEVKEVTFTIIKIKNQNTEQKGTNNIDDTISAITDTSFSQMR